MSNNSEIWTQYVKLETIGTGNFGKIFKAKNIKTSNIYVIKEIDKLKYKSLTNNDFNENSIKKLNLANNIKIKEIIDSGDFLYIIMELCPLNLEYYLKIRENNLSIDEIRELLIQLNIIFQKINELNLIIRDIKPSNILFSFDKISKLTLKISDYDLSQFLIDKKNLNISLTMSPEVLKGENISNKNNVWILGNIIYYMVFKEYLYNAKNSSQLINAINKSKKPKSTPDKDLTDLISKMLVVDANKRISFNEYLNHSFFKKNINNQNEINNLQLNTPFFNFICKTHSKQFVFFCTNCKCNICNSCLTKHPINSHKIIPFSIIGLSDIEIGQIGNLLNELEINLNKLRKLKNNTEIIYNKMKLVKSNISIYDTLPEYNFKNYFIQYLQKINKDLIITDSIIFPQFKSNNENKGNYIICEHIIKQNQIEKSIPILNYMTEAIISVIGYGENNKDEITKDCDIYINNKKIDFTLKYKFPKEGKYIIKIEYKKLIKNMNCMFANCETLKLIDLSNFKTENVTSMIGLFTKCTSLTTLDLSKINLNKNNNLSYMFSGCSSLLSLDLSYFFTSKINNIKKMFNGCTSLSSIDLSNFDTKNITTMESLFENCSSISSIDLKKFKTENVTNMKSMFKGCTLLKNLDLSHFDTGNVTDMSFMFSECESLNSINLSNFKTENVVDLSSMFFGCSSINSIDVSNFNTGNLIDIKFMFCGCKNLKNLNISNFNITSVTDISGMFKNCSSLTSLDLSSFHTENVLEMNNLFEGCDSLKKLNLTNFNTENVMSMDEMFWDNVKECEVICNDENIKSMIK